MIGQAVLLDRPALLMSEVGPQLGATGRFKAQVEFADGRLLRLWFLSFFSCGDVDVARRKILRFGRRRQTAKKADD